MKGDFSRLPLDPATHATGVWMQQGRVQLDADWNEQVALSAERARAVARDAMGGSGAPARDPGFQVALRSALRFDGRRTTAVVECPGFDPCAPFTLEVRVSARAGCACTLLEWAGRYALSLTAGGGIVFRLGGRPGEDAPDDAAAGAAGEPEAYGPASRASGGVHGSAGVASAAARKRAVAVPRALPAHGAAWVAAVFDGTAGCIYVDGELAACASLRHPPTPRADDAPLSLGGTVRDGVPRDVLDGELLEARVWARALTAAEVRAGAARGPGHGAPGLAAWWPMDEGHGGWARDASGNGFDAELGGVGTDAPRWRPPSLFIGAGRYWVEGVACENPRELLWSAQPSLPRARTPRARADVLVYLEAWDRYVSAAEDPSLREVALAGGDTAGRTRTVWQVRTVELPREEHDDAGEEGDPRTEDWSRHLPPALGDGRLTARGGTAADNRLYRVEVRGGGGAYGWPRPEPPHAAAVAAVDPAGHRVRLDEAADPGGWRVGQQVELFSRATDAAERAGTLHRVTEVEGAADGCGLALVLAPPPPQISPADRPRLRPVATFVWSRDNGSAAWPVLALDAAGETAVLDDGGRSGLLPARDEWVEVTDDAHALGGVPGTLCRVRRVDDATLTVDLDPAASGVSGDPRQRPVLRRWDPVCGAHSGAEGVVKAGEWITLDPAVSVRFDAGGYRTGDWWTIPVREGAPGGIEWPAGPGGPRALPPQGIVRYAAPLALVRHRRGRAHVHDLRQVLSPSHAGDFVRRTGSEWMAGPLRIHGDLTVGGALRARLAEGSVGTGPLADHAVTHAKLADHAVTEGKLAEHAVTEHKLAEHAVTEHKLAEHAVTRSRLAKHAVSHHQLAEHAVTEGKLAPGAVGWDALSDGVKEAIEGFAPPVEGGPAGAVVLTGSRTPPAGYAPLDAALTLPAVKVEWRAVDALPIGDLAGAVCAAHGGALYVLSGTGAEFWRWRPADGAWEPLAAPGRRRGAALCAGGPRLFLLGGMDGSDDPVNTAQAFDPVLGTWAPVAPLPTARAWFGAAELDGWIYAVGGRGERMAVGHASGVVEAYHHGMDLWEPRRDMHLRRVHPGVAAAAGEVYAVGGAGRVHLGAGRTATSESYDPVADRWTRRPKLPRPRMQCAAAALQDRVYVAGGREDDAPATSDARRFDPATNSWSPFARLPAVLRGPSAAAIDGVLYVVGGAGDQGAPNAVVYACRLFTSLYAHRREG